MALDADLIEVGSDMVLRRTVGATNQIHIDVAVRGVARSPHSEELVGAMTQSDSFVIISPTQIIAAQWPGGQPANVVHPDIPRKGDKIIIAGLPRNVEIVNPFFVGDELVRIEIRTLGAG